MADDAVVVPVERTSTLRSTVAHVVSEAARGETAAVHFVYLASWRDDDPHVEQQRAAVNALLDQVATWARYDLEDTGTGAAVDIETAVLGSDAYLFGPEEYADRLYQYAREHGIGTVVVDPEYTPVGNTTLLQPLEFELSATDLIVREAPVERPARHERLVKEVTGVRFAAVFGVSLLFYLVLGDPSYWFDWVTGVASAAIVAITLSQISLDHDPTISGTPGRIVRGTLYVPVLLFEIVKSNLVVARVILSPSLPVKPSMTRVRVLVGSGLPLMTLSNSITLTPGTLTVRARDENLYVHTLIPWARQGLFDGSLERWSRFIYYGREAARLPSPQERGDTAILQGPEADEGIPFAQADGGVVDDDGSARDANAGESGPGDDAADPEPEPAAEPPVEDGEVADG